MKSYQIKSINGSFFCFDQSIILIFEQNIRINGFLIKFKILKCILLKSLLFYIKVLIRVVKYDVESEKNVKITFFTEKKIKKGDRADLKQ